MNLGEVVELGHHRLVCGDAFNPEHRELLLQGEKADMLYCDPPYGIDLSGDMNKNYERRGKGKADGSLFDARLRIHRHADVANDSLPFSPATIIDAFASCREQFWWGANNYASRLPDIESGSWITWDKRREGPIDRMLGSQFELCWSRKRHRYEIARILWAGVTGMLPVDGCRVHPTQKPVRLAEWFLSRYSKEGGIILDLFAGSGSTLLACERMNRRALVMEISPDYCDVVQQRYEAMTRQKRLIA